MLGGMEFHPSASIGIVVSTTGYTIAEDILRDADTAMYRAKEKGRGRFEIFDESMRESVVDMMAVESGIRTALEHGEFQLYYQPIVHVGTARLHHFEALLRWPSSSRGFIPPDEFIPVAEDSGLIVPLGEWVLREACRQMKEWETRFPDRGPLRVSVNISAKQFSRSNLFETVRQVLQETGFAPANLDLEITESVVLEEPERVHQDFLKLRELGVRLHLDDFGTGFSSLGYLRRYPVDCIKIDRSFVSNMHEVKENREIVRSITVMAEALGIEVVAEGVELPEHLALLQEFGCPMAQGFLFSKARRADELEVLLDGEWNHASVSGFMVRV
jgi:EAL domain-containing protein (putative c-di-GMP-specific phosphodiesterase class I)